MNNIFTYYQFVNESVYSPLDSYKSLTLTLARAFSILFYLENIANPNLDNREWNLLLSKVKGERDLDPKFDLLVQYATKKHTELKQYARQRSKEMEGKFGYFAFDVAVLSERIPDVIKNLKQASDLLTANLSKEKIETRSKLIDEALPKEREYVLESIRNTALYESNETRNPPFESDILILVDQISANIISIRTVARSIISVYPDSSGYVKNVVSQYLDPQEEKLRTLTDLKGSYSDKAIPKSVIKAYEQRGWRIKNSAEKSAVDLFIELEKLAEEVSKAGDMVRQASQKVSDSLSSNDAAGQWISAANEMLDKIEDQIQRKEEMEKKNRRRRSMLPTPDEETPKTDSIQPPDQRSITDEMNRLRDILGNRR